MSDTQTDELLAALDRRNVHSARDLQRYDEQSLDLVRLTEGIHQFTCGDFRHRPKERPQIGWICERGARKVATVYAEHPDAALRESQP